MFIDHWNRIECSKTSPCLQENLIYDRSGPNEKGWFLYQMILRKQVTYRKNIVSSQKYNLD